jgi:pimeloyl-ACP methyl ester carboxylesterase
VAHHAFATADGRQVGVTAAGDPISRRLLILCPPTPGAGMFDPDPLATAASGVRLVSLDRPGNGSSDPLPADTAPTIERCADDIAEYLRYSEKLADRLSHTEFGSIAAVGWGTGGLVALSLAARNPSLVDHVVAVATPAPRALRRDIRSRRRHLLRGGPMLPSVLLATAPDDPAYDRPGAANRIERMLAEAYEQGEAGVWSDLRMLDDRRWARELRRVRATVTFVRGGADLAVGPADVRWYRRRMHHARAVAVRDAGPLVIVTAWKRILDLQSQQ